MGTRADFYVGRGEDAEWLGSIAWDGYPDGGIPDEIKTADSEDGFRRTVAAFIDCREDGTVPSDGWPWPWETSHTTDYAYSFEAGKVYASSFGSSWWAADAERPENDDGDASEATVFPDMSSRQNVTPGRRSGVMVVESKP